MPQKISAQFVCPNPSFGFLKKSSLCVRSPWSGSWKFKNNWKHFEHNGAKGFCIVLGVGNQIGDESIKSFLQLHLQAKNIIACKLKRLKGIWPCATPISIMGSVMDFFK